MKVVHNKGVEVEIWKGMSAQSRHYNKQRPQQQAGGRMQLSKARCIDNKDLKEQLAVTRARRDKKVAAAARKLAREKREKDKEVEEILQDIRVGRLDKDSN